MQHRIPSYTVMAAAESLAADQAPAAVQFTGLHHTCRPARQFGTSNEQAGQDASSAVTVTCQETKNSTR